MTLAKKQNSSRREKNNHDASSGHSSKKYTVFCDESGNSGSNYLDFDQPFYTIAGWIVPNEEINNTCSVLDCAKSLSVTGELHGSNIIRGKRGQKAIHDLFLKIGKIGCIPSFIIAEKKFCIAAKIIEVLLDPEYNKRVSKKFTYDKLAKKEIAEIIYKFPNETLEIFAHGYISKDTNIIKDSIKSISLCFNLVDKSNISKILLGSLGLIDKNILSERECDDYLPNKAMASLNLPVIVSYFNMIEKLGRSIDAEFTMVHDETKQLEPAFCEVFKRFANAIPAEVSLTDGTKIVLGFKKLNNLSFSNSKENLWIQSADLLSSTINRCSKLIINDNNLNKQLKELFNLIFPALLIEQFSIADWICSDITKFKFINLLTSSKTA